MNRAKLLLICMLIITAPKLYAQGGKCDSITWQADRKLTWADFKAQADSTTILTSNTSFDLSREWDVKGNVLTTTMLCYFNPCRSWSKNKKSDKLLAHEQGHFDIAEFYRRLYNKRVSETRFTQSNLSRMMEKIFRDVNKECQVIQRAYDKETVHSMNEARQTLWLEKISAMLTNLKDYTQREVTVNLNQQFAGNP